MSLGHWSDLYSGGVRLSRVDLDFRGSQRHDNLSCNGSPKALYERRPPTRIESECYSSFNYSINNMFSQVWPCIWSASHGPSLVAEKALAEEGLERWHLSRIDDEDETPIFLSVKNNQRVFNGYGAQETCDMLFEALIFPAMPTFAVCKDPDVWHRFKTAAFDYQDIHWGLVNSKPIILPYVSGCRPFRFNQDGHNKFLRHVSTYRRQFVKVERDTLAKINEFNLLDFKGTLQDNGTALGM
jgi:hypothetical protein